MKGDLDRAFADYDQAIRLDPHDATAYNGRGNVYQAKQDYRARARRLQSGDRARSRLRLRLQ
jgi:tetratricopeptide (TPR) repeat protein